MALHAEQKPVVWRGRVVDAILVDDQGPDQAAEFQQRMPVAAVARQTGGFQRQHSADAALADRGEKLLKARPPRAGSRSPEVIVDHFDVRRPQLTGPIGQAVLSSLALEIVHDLNGCRLADVDDSLARKVLRRDLRRARFLPTVQARHRFRQQHSQLLDGLRPLDIAEADALRRLLEQIPLCTRPMLGHQLLPRGSHSPGRRLRQSPGTLVNREAARSRDAEPARP